ARAAQAQWGQPVRWIEAQGYAVRDSARYSAALLRAERIDSVVLVAHAWKMPRAIAEYQAAGLRVIPAPMAFPAPVVPTLADWMPTSEGLRWVRNVLRERFGLWSSVLRSGA
ncbi:MAG: ElyC/SanA/YdcF family protein, partial [Burkholderiaceae bacterium]|nr:ElyC/SanA/YdcF family protein [Burkholderiaceae bacterium]